jgi:hypothetical protein
MVFVCLVFFGFTAHQQSVDHNYGAKTGKMILASLRCYKLSATQGVKTTSQAVAKRRTKDSNNSTHLGTSYNQAGSNGGCNSDASNL